MEIAKALTASLRRHERIDDLRRRPMETFSFGRLMAVCQPDAAGD